MKAKLSFSLESDEWEVDVYDGDIDAMKEEFLTGLAKHLAEQHPDDRAWLRDHIAVELHED